MFLYCNLQLSLTNDKFHDDNTGSNFRRINRVFLNNTERRTCGTICKIYIITMHVQCYQCCIAAMQFENCSADPRVGNILTSPEFTLVSDQELTFTMVFMPSNNHSNVNVHKTSILGHIDTLLGSYSSPWNITAVVNATHSICLPTGTYQLVFIAAGSENVTLSTAILKEVLLSNSSCTYTTPPGN